MVRRSYGQHCGFARALELIGERWALLIVRDLLVGEKRFSEIQRGLPGIPTNILTARLNELEDSGLVRRRVLARPAKGVVYELTEDGVQLEEAVVALGRWGARHLGDPREDETVTEDSIATALRTTFRPEAAGKAKVTYLLRLGPIEVHARVHDGGLTVGRGPVAKPDLVIETGPALRLLLAREVSPSDALKKRLVKITGEPKLLDRFAQMFRI
ncbi:MAG: helix-turn-helix transcriptional regulator [Candidatus Eremiobacteraeota bacterium]|nr:helix-turn-helix transcriptional regulator [Candidatus Eremiobacteraeota bacterium]MBV9056785.1 helix-turn-helix transcriptional regulator [Candidatus Eremiobacteraeota bacterium]MBV9701070.1 helix-turn-helix transcriptional regulator [Candidatus Eremiobacteraeota bacterium]